MIGITSPAAVRHQWCSWPLPLIGWAAIPAVIGSAACYAALGAFPPRQFDVMVLRYIGRYDTKRISWYMGIKTRTVDYHCRKAREHLSPVYQRILKCQGGDRMNTWEERLAGASTCESRRPFDVAAGLRRLAQDAGYLPPPAPAPARERPDSTSARLTAVTSWSVTQARPPRT